MRKVTPIVLCHNLKIYYLFVIRRDGIIETLVDNSSVSPFVQPYQHLTGNEMVDDVLAVLHNHNYKTEKIKCFDKTLYNIVLIDTENPKTVLTTYISVQNY